MIAVDGLTKRYGDKTAVRPPGSVRPHVLAGLASLAAWRLRRRDA
jgi:hypothetical protein